MRAHRIATVLWGLGLLALIPSVFFGTLIQTACVLAPWAIYTLCTDTKGGPAARTRVHVYRTITTSGAALGAWIVAFIPMSNPHDAAWLGAIAGLSSLAISHLVLACSPLWDTVHRLWPTDAGMEEWLGTQIAAHALVSGIAAFPVRVLLREGGARAELTPVQRDWTVAQKSVALRVERALHAQAAGRAWPASWYALIQPQDGLAGIRTATAIIRNPAINLVHPITPSAHTLLAARAAAHKGAR